jgi:hypothetical protein
LNRDLKQGLKEFNQKWEELRSEAISALKEEQLFATFDLNRTAAVRQEIGKQIVAFADNSPLSGLLGRNPRAILARMEEFRLFPGLAEFAFGYASLLEGKEEGESVSFSSRYLREAPGTDWSLRARDMLQEELRVCYQADPDKSELKLSRKLLRPADTSMQDVFDFALLAGANVSGEDGFELNGEVFFVDDSGSLAQSKACFSPVAIVTAEGCHEATKEQSALIALLVGYATVVNSGHKTGTDGAKAVFSKQIQETCSQFLESAEWGYVDPERALDKASSRKVVGLAWHTAGLRVVSSRRHEVSDVDLDKGFRKIHPEYRVVVSNGRYYPGGIKGEEGKVYVISTDTAKGAKRMRMSACTQLEPASKVESSVVHRGVVGEGSIVEVLLAPDGLPMLFGGGPGGVIDMTGGKFGEVMSVLDRKTYSGTSFAILSQEDRKAFEASLPKVGDPVGEVLEIHGAASRRIPRGERGIVTKVRVVSESRQYRNLRWMVTVEFVNRSGLVKVRGPLKAMVTKAIVARLRSSTLLHRDVLSNQLAVAGWEGEHLLASMDAFKGTGKGNARFRVEIATETLRHFLPMEEAWELLKNLLPSKALDSKGRVIYREDWDYEGVYDALVAEFERRFQKRVKVAMCVDPTRFDLLIKAYAKNKEIVWEPVREGGVTARTASFQIGIGITGQPTYLHFTVYENGRCSVMQETTAFRTAMLLKAEHVGVREVCTRAPMMLEVAYAAKALGMHKLAEYIEEGGRKRARGVIKINDLANGVRYTRYLQVKMATETLRHFLSMEEARQLLKNLLPSKALDSEGRVTYRPEWDQEGVYDALLSQGPKVRGVDVTNLSEEDAELLRNILDGDLAEWPEELYVYATDGKQHVTLAAELLEIIPYESPQFGAIRGILESGINGDRLRLGNFVRVLKSGLLKMTAPTSTGLYKKLHTGGNAVYCKRVPIFGDHAGIHQELHVNTHGKVASMLARDFGCKPSELEGKYVVRSRDPMFIPVVMRIVLDKNVGEYVVGISDYSCSADNGDADGDTDKILAIVE